MSPEQLTEATQPSSLLFLSCDLVDSTTHKKSNQAWRRTFLTFYRGFPQSLAEQVAVADSPVTFNLWKIIGDELIYTCEVAHERAVDSAVRIWLAAMQRYEIETLQPEGMKLKGGAFLATFPGPDTRIAVPLDPLTERSDRGVVELNDLAIADSQNPYYLRDFFGPSIDIGFKLLKISDARHFTLSLEVAWAMCEHAAASGDLLTDLRVFGAQRLSNLWPNGPYPNLAIDREVSTNGNGVEDRIRSLTVTPSPIDDLRELFRSCHGDSDWPSAIYLQDSAVPDFAIKPADCLYSLRTNSMDGAESHPDQQLSGRPLGAKRARSALDQRAGLT